MKTRDFLKHKQEVDAMNNQPDPNGNNIIFGVRKECITPNLTNAARERLGYRPELQSAFHQCQTKKPRW
jgi:hypothetical protein